MFHRKTKRFGDFRSTSGKNRGNPRELKKEKMKKERLWKEKKKKWENIINVSKDLVLFAWRLGKGKRTKVVMKKEKR